MGHRLAILFAVALLATIPAAFAADTIGQAIAVSGTVYGRLGGEPQRQLTEGAGIYAGDRIITGPDGRVELRFADNARFMLGPGSELSVGQYSYKPGDEKNVMETSVLTGVFRFFSGLIAKKRPQQVRINMPVATIGIRGTHIIGEVTATSATVALMEPEEAGTATAIEVSNQYGIVVIDKPRYETVIPDAHSPPSPPRRVQVQRINNLMRSIQTIRRITVPRPPPRLP